MFRELILQILMATGHQQQAALPPPPPPRIPIVCKAFVKKCPPPGVK